MTERSEQASTERSEQASTERSEQASTERSEQASTERSEQARDDLCERMDEPLFDRTTVGGVEVLVPHERASGPWFPGVQHGGAVAGIVMRAIEGLPSAVPMAVTRLTLDLSRKVPLRATTVETRVVRDGMRVQAVEAVVAVDGVEVSRATALRLRTAVDVIDEHIDVPRSAGR